MQLLGMLGSQPHHASLSQSLSPLQPPTPRSPQLPAAAACRLHCLLLLLVCPQVGTFTLFQETYHRPTFKTMHISGPKSDFDHRLLTQDRAFRGGIDDVGIGTLFGLYDYRFVWGGVRL